MELVSFSAAGPGDLSALFDAGAKVGLCNLSCAEVFKAAGCVDLSVEEGLFNLPCAVVIGVRGSLLGP
jgi:hypothetical protein